MNLKVIVNKFLDKGNIEKPEPGQYLYDSLRSATCKEDLGLKDLDKSPNAYASELSRAHREQQLKEYIACQDKRFAL